jgi:hypothetical protein
VPLTSSILSHLLLCGVSAALSLGNMDVPALLAEVARAWEAAIAVKVACVTAVLAA